MKPTACVIHRHAVALALAVSVVALVACKRHEDAAADPPRKARPHPTAPAPSPRVVFLRGGDKGANTLLIGSTEGDAAPIELDVPRPTSARAIEDGRALLIATKPEGATQQELWRVTVDADGKVDKTRWTSLVRGTMVLASDDGAWVLVSDVDATAKVDTLTLVGTGAGGSSLPLTTFRYYAGGELSADGHTALVSGTPVACTGALNRCPMEVRRVTIAAGTAKVDVVHAPTTGAAYQPRALHAGGLFGSDADVLFQTTERDASPGCLADLNACRHDLVVVRGDDPMAPPRLLRESGFGPALSSSGDRLAFLSLDETKCTKLPCFEAALLVGPLEGPYRRIDGAGVSLLTSHAFSPDGAYLAFRGAAEPTDSFAKVCRVDGSGCKKLGVGSPQCWLR